MSTARTAGMVEYAMRRHSCEKRLQAAARTAAAAERYEARGVTRECTHKTHHEHGTNARARLDRCRCAPCRAASSRASKEYELRTISAPVNVDATAATSHVRALMAAGMGWKRVAKAAGLDTSLVYPLLYGRPDRNGGAPRTKARARTVAALLAVPYPTLDDIADGALVPVHGTARRLRALHSVGWSVRAIGERSGVDEQSLYKSIEGRHEQLLARNARLVRDAFDALWNVAPPSGTKWERAAATRARNLATEHGWPMPLDLDEGAIDDPAAPEPTRAVEQRTGVDLDEWLHLVLAGEDQERAAARLGVQLASVQTVAQRRGRRDVMRLIAERHLVLKPLRTAS
ncbi:hypothetical protein ACFWGN_17950 [Oerskovia sp. NPDC060338]|uniref:hypothetical protein n=1 Tax=Oerskovia sp. NPDC060338 TaxID=3347100 RepID=UPI0036467F6B